MTGRFKEPLPPEVREAQREEGQQRDRELFEDTGNAFYVWWALARYRAGEELPLWVREWLLKFALDEKAGILTAYLHRPAITTPATDTCPATVDRPEYIPNNDEVRARVLHAFSLSQGKDTVAQVQSHIADDALALMRVVGMAAPPGSRVAVGYSVKELAKFMDVQKRQLRYRTNRALKRWPK